MAVESRGTSEPFTHLTNDGTKLQTSVKNNTMNDIWNELLIFNDDLI